VCEGKLENERFSAESRIKFSPKRLSTRGLGKQKIHKDSIPMLLFRE
jgi:hypothetical protein